MLRASGLPVTTSAVMDAVRALEAVDLMDRAEVYLTLQTVLMSRIEEQPAFDRCFEAFWKFHADEGQGLDGLVAAVQQKEQDDGRRECEPNVGERLVTVVRGCSSFRRRGIRTLIALAFAL